jgi:hypothetical protein
MVGHYDYNNQAHYDAASTGKMFSNITGLSVGLGLTLGLATLCSQAHGAGRAAIENPIHLRRCGVVLSFAFVYTLLVSWKCRSMLIAMKQPVDVSTDSAYYVQVQVVGIPFFWAATALQTVTDGLQNTKPGLYANTLSSVIQVSLCVIFVHPSMLGEQEQARQSTIAMHLTYILCAGMGYLGMAAARSVGGLVCLAVMIFYIKWYKIEHLVWGSSRSSRSRRSRRSSQSGANSGGDDNDGDGSDSFSDSDSDSDSDFEHRGRSRIKKKQNKSLSARRLKQISSGEGSGNTALSRTPVKWWTCESITTFLAVAIPSAIVCWIEWWAFEGLSVLVGMLPNAR